MKRYPEELFPDPTAEHMLDEPERFLFCMFKLKLYAGISIKMDEEEIYKHLLFFVQK